MKRTLILAMIFSLSSALFAENTLQEDFKAIITSTGASIEEINDSLKETRVSLEEGAESINDIDTLFEEAVKKAYHEAVADEEAGVWTLLICPTLEHFKGFLCAFLYVIVDNGIPEEANTLVHNYEELVNFMFSDLKINSSFDENTEIIEDDSIQSVIIISDGPELVEPDKFDDESDDPDKVATKKTFDWSMFDDENSFDENTEIIEDDTLKKMRRKQEKEIQALMAQAEEETFKIKRKCEEVKELVEAKELRR